MRKIAFFILLFGSFGWLGGASAQVRLVPLSTFGPNGDGTLLPADTANYYLTADGNRLQRGLAYNPQTGHLLIANRNGMTLHVIDAFTGAEVNTLRQDDPRYVGNPEFLYNMIGVADDGAIYVCNLTSSSALVEFVLYRWADETSSPQTVVYGPANPGDGSTGNIRWGDSLAVRGAGMNTEILVASRGNLVALLRPADASMTSFTSTPLTTDLPSDAISFGLAFGPGSTFYGNAAASERSVLYHLSYDPAVGKATTLHAYGPYEFPGRIGALAVHAGSNWLAGVEMTPGAAPDRVRLYDIANPAAVPAFLDRQDVASWTNANTLFSGAVVFGETNVYALDSDNGIVAFTMTPGSNTYAPVIFGEPVGQVVQLTSNVVFSVGADGTAPLAYQWLFQGREIADATSSAYALASADVTNSGGYSVVITNVYGALTSSVASLIVLASYGNTLFYEPFAYSAGTPLDGQGGWEKGGSGSGRFTNVLGNLSIPQLAPAVSNHVLLYNASGVTSRKQIGHYTKGALYFSFALQLDDLTPPTTTSETVVALASGTGATYTPKINVEAYQVTNYTIGVYKGTGTTYGGVATNADGSPMLFDTNSVVFVVGRVVFGPGSSDDTCDLWINPNPSTFGATVAPVPSIGPIGAGRADVTPIDRFVLRFSAGYNGRHIDEVRCGFDWAGVTPSAIPALAIARAGQNAKLMWPTNVSTGFTLVSMRGFDDPDGWQPVDATVTPEGATNTVTVPLQGSARLFRLQK